MNKISIDKNIEKYINTQIPMTCFYIFLFVDILFFPRLQSEDDRDGDLGTAYLAVVFARFPVWHHPRYT